VATDSRGRAITAEHIEGMERFNQNEVPRKLCYRPSTCITFELDEAYINEQEEDAEIYAHILPTQIHDNLAFLPVVGEELLCAKQYAGEIIDSRAVLKQFRVVRIAKEIDQDTTCLCLSMMVYVVPVEVEQEKGSPAE